MQLDQIQNSISATNRVLISKMSKHLKYLEESECRIGLQNLDQRFTMLLLVVQYSHLHLLIGGLQPVILNQAYREVSVRELKMVNISENQVTSLSTVAASGF